MIEDIKLLKRSIKAADITLTDVIIKDLYKQVNELLVKAKRIEKINHKYSVYFDKTLSDGIEPEQAASELGLN